jgi:NAD(P)-dependent dehydrogenase (short-subunit alcohol dehydrogenase family)
VHRAEDAPDVTSSLPNNPMGRAAMPEDIADACIFLSCSISNYVNGPMIVVNGAQLTGTSLIHPIRDARREQS